MNLTALENFTVTSKITEVTHKWNNTHFIPKQLGARFVAFVTIPVTCALDVIFHSVLFVGKSLSGIVITPLNAVLKNPELADFELSSAFVHLLRAVQSLYELHILPFIALLDPTKANALMPSNKDNASENSEIIRLNGEMTRLQNELLKNEKIERERELTPLRNQVNVPPVLPFRAPQEINQESPAKQSEVLPASLPLPPPPPPAPNVNISVSTKTTPIIPRNNVKSEEKDEKKQIASPIVLDIGAITNGRNNLRKTDSNHESKKKNSAAPSEFTAVMEKVKEVDTGLAEDVNDNKDEWEDDITLNDRQELQNKPGEVEKSAKSEGTAAEKIKGFNLLARHELRLIEASNNPFRLSHIKQELEGIISILANQIGVEDFDNNSLTQSVIHTDMAKSFIANSNTLMTPKERHTYYTTQVLPAVLILMKKQDG